MDLYQELELSRECSAEQIKNQYRALAQRYHPDKGGDVEKFQRIKLAYEVLIDPVRRQEYDRSGSTLDQKNLHDEALEHLSKIFQNVTGNFDAEQGDLVEIMRNEVRNLINLVQQNIEMCNKHISMLEIMQNKIKIINEQQENFLLSFVNNQLEMRHNEIKTFQRRILISEEMLLLLENYHYGFFELPR